MLASQLVRLSSCRPPHHGLTALQHVGPAVVHLELEQLLHFVVGRAVGAKNRRWQDHIRVTVDLAEFERILLFYPRG